MENWYLHAFTFCEVEPGQLLCALVQAGRYPALGSRVGLRLDSAQAHAFDARGARIGP